MSHATPGLDRLFAKEKKKKSTSIAEGRRCASSLITEMRGEGDVGASFSGTLQRRAFLFASAVIERTLRPKNKTKKVTFFCHRDYLLMSFTASNSKLPKSYKV